MHFNEIPKLTLGSCSLYIKDEFLANTPSLLEIPDEPFPQYVRSFNLVDPTSAEATFEAEIDIPMVHRFSGIFDASMLGGQSFSTEFSEPYQEQRRKHKKKRINKKWAKRYGYRTEYCKVTLQDVKVTPNGYSGFELSGIPVKY